jgi:tetratricopeptide (TPR) repeat protein
MHGQLGEADRWAEAAAEAGSEGEPDALMLYGAMTSASALEAGREDEVVELLEQSAEDNPGLPAFAGALALAYSRLGRADEAREVLRGWRDSGFDKLARDVAWTSALSLFARATAELGDRQAAADLLPLLLPLRGLCCTNGSTGFGSVDQCLGLLAVTAGDHELADEYFAAAVEFETKADMRSSLALTRLSWARSLLSRSGDECEKQARALLEQAAEASRVHGFARYLHEAESLLADRVSA